MSKIVFVNPPLTTKERYGVHFQSGGETPPLGLASLAAVVAQYGIGTRIIDGAISNSYQYVLREIIDEKPSYVGVTASTVSIYNAAKVAQMVKEANPTIVTIIGGPHITAVPLETMKKFLVFDIGVIGEAEHTIIELLNVIERGGDLFRVNGIVFRSNEQVVRTEGRAPIVDLDVLPKPAWNLLPSLSVYYCPPVHTVKRLPAALMVTSRGCPARCLPSDERILMADGVSTKPISEIKMYDMVSSINELGAMATNCVVTVRRTPARCDIIKIVTQEGRILRCTTDHRVLTRNGWKEAGTLKAGDWVVKKREYAINPSETTIGFGKADAQTTSVNKQSHEKSRHCGEKQTITTRQHRGERASTTANADKQSHETATYQRQGQPEYEGLLQSIKRSRTESKSQWCNCAPNDDQSRETKVKREDEKEQSYEGKGDKRQSNGHFETEVSLQPQELFREMVSEENWAESHRSGIGATIGSSRIQVCGGWEILDRSLPEWEVQKSRFYLGEWPTQDRAPLQFDILAQSSISRRPRNDGGLQRERVEYLRDYRGDDEATPKDNPLGDSLVTFCQVVSITPDKPADVFDIETIPHHNFIASGFVVHNCTFCDRSVFGNLSRANSAEYVMEMVQELYQHYGIREFQFRDDNFLAFRRRLVKLCTLIKTEKLDIAWSLAGRIDMVNPSVLALLSEAGCWQIWYGIESGSQHILDFINKRTKLDKIREVVRWTKEAGISACGFFMIGLPTETGEDIENTIRFSRELDLDEAHFTFFTPFPGCELYGNIRQYGEFDEDWHKASCWSPAFVPNGMSSKQLVRYWKKATIGFYLRPRIVMNYIRKMKSPRHIKIYFSGLMALFEAVLWKRYISKGKRGEEL